MISKKTIFVLGAGSSCEYFYPTGADLITQVYKLANTGSKMNFLISTLEANGVVDAPKKVEDFRSAIAFSSTNSIDDFLAKRSDLKEVGKLCVAQVISGYERESSFVYEDNKPERLHRGWYSVLWNKMIEISDTSGDLIQGLHLLPKNQVVFITFNYDRSLEYFLFKSARALFNRSDEDTAAIINKIPIYHVYGQLGKLDWQTKADDDVTHDYLPFHEEKPSDRAYTENARTHNYEVSRQIVTYTERKQLSGYRNMAEACIQTKQIHFLGFGFHCQNLQILAPVLNRLPDLETVFGTSYGMDKTAKDRVYGDVNEVLGINIDKGNLHDLTISDLYRHKVNLK